MAIFASMEQMIGATPLLVLNRLKEELKYNANLLVKLESYNPGGSAKDRVALSMLNAAETDGRLRPGGTVIEPTSGNTGIGLTAVAAARGYRAIIVMPDTMSAERRTLMTAYGAELVLTDGAGGMAAAIEKAEQLHRSIPGSIVAGQFSNSANPAAHEKTTGPEIWRDTDGHVDIFVATVGTGGTISGTGRYLKAQNPAIRVVGVEPAASPVLSGGKAGPHGIQGIGAGFVPAALDTSVYDEIFTVTDQDALAAARALGPTEGFLAGISSGAAIHCAVELAKRPENHGKNIVVLLPDSGERYLSTALYQD